MTIAVLEEHELTLARAIDEAPGDAQAPCTFEAILRVDGLIEAAGELYESKETSEMAGAFSDGMPISVIRRRSDPYRLWVTGLGARPFAAFRIGRDSVSIFSRQLRSIRE